MADVTFRPLFDDSQINAALDKLDQTTRSVEDEVRQLGDTVDSSMKEAASGAEGYEKALGDASKEVTELTKKQKLLKSGSDQAGKAAKSLGDKIEDLAGEVNILGVNLGTVVKGLRSKASAMVAATRATAGTSKAMKLFRVALISTGIGAIVVALGSLVALLTKTQRGVDFVSRVMAGLGTAVDVVIGRLATLGSAIVKVFQGDFKGAVDDAKGAVEGLGEELEKEVGLALELERATQRLRDRAREVNVEAAKQEATVERLRNIAEDQTKTEQERIQALNESLELQTEIENERVAIAEERLRIIREQNALNESLSDDLDAEAEAEIELARIRAEAASRRREDENKLREILRSAAEERRRALEEERARVQALNEEYTDLISKFQEQIQEAELFLLGDEERLIKEREIAEAQINEFVDNVKAAAAAAGRELPPGFDEGITTLFQEVDEKFKAELQKLRGEITLTDALPTEITPGDEQKLTEQAEAYAEATQQAFSKVTQGPDYRSAFQKIQDSLLETFQIDEAQAQFIVGQFSDLFNSVVTLSAQASEREIAQQQAVIDARQERVDRLSDQLSEEQQKQEQGLANNVSALESALSKEQRVIQNARNKQIEEERKAANQQLVINSVQQASEITLAAAKLISSQASAGLLALVTIPAALALLFSIVAGARANAKDAAQVPTLRKGGKLKGLSHEQGGIPIVVQGQQVAEAEGGEWVIGSSPSNRHDSFLEKLNAGRYNDINLYELAEARKKQSLNRTIKRVKDNEQAIREGDEIQRLAAIQGVYQNAASEAADKMIDYWKSRPVVTPLGAPVMREWQEGTTKRKEVVTHKG